MWHRLRGNRGSKPPMDISYAQNLEDYYLSRAFEGQESGF
jgi:hypothetical protein